MKNKVKLRAIIDIDGFINRKAGDEFYYSPWNFEWQGMSENERLQKGLFIHCFGHGEFEALRIGSDVEKIYT